MARGRKPIPVTFDGLQEAIVSVEWDGALPNRNALWQAVAATKYAKSIGLSAQVAMVKAKGFGKALMIATPFGKKGLQKKEAKSKPNTTSLPMVDATPKAPRRKYVYSTEVIERMLKKFPKSMHKRVRAAARGNKRQQIALNCYECMGFSKAEVRRCDEKICTFWTSRPWQKGKLPPEE